MSLFTKAKKLPHFLYLKLHEKQFKGITYVEKACDSDALLIGFSSFSKHGNPPNYNYVKTLSGICANQLFILDNYGYNRAGCYYLGENGNWFMPEQMIELVRRIVRQKGIGRIITFGSSKGGSAALYYGIRLQADLAVIGAPQYHLGDYLKIEKHKEIAKGILGSLEPESIQRLNEVLPDAIRRNAGRSTLRVIVHYSPKEHTYPEHIKDMVSDLRSNGYGVQEDNDYTYLNHDEVGEHFTSLLLRTLQKEGIA